MYFRLRGTWNLEPGTNFQSSQYSINYNSKQPYQDRALDKVTKPAAKADNNPAAPAVRATLSILINVNCFVL